MLPTPVDVWMSAQARINMAPPKKRRGPPSEIADQSMELLTLEPLVPVPSFVTGGAGGTKEGSPSEDPSTIPESPSSCIAIRTLS